MTAAKSAQDLQKLTAAEPRNAAAWHQFGNALLDEGKTDRGISAFRRALRIDDTLAEVHNDLGSAYFEKGWQAEAEACFRKAIEFRPEHGIAHANLGAALRAQGRLVDSRRAYQRALLLKLRAVLPRFLRWRIGASGSAPPQPPASDEARPDLKAMAEALAARDLEKARSLAGAAEKRHPEAADVLHLCAVILEESRDYAAALPRVRAAIERKPDRTEYHITLARLLLRTHDYQGALDAASRALKLEPGSADVHAAIAGLYHPWRHDLAEQAARRAIELDAASHAGHGNLAAALWALGRLEEAEKHAREAIRLKPSHLPHRLNLALVLKDLGQVDEARAIYRAMAEQAPSHPKLCLDMGTLAIECDGDLEGARRWYRAAGSEPKVVLSGAIVDLLDGRFETAWERYEARKEALDQHFQHSHFAALPAWRGETLSGARLLVYGEQGLGDEIMFASIYEDLSRRVAEVTVLCDARLGALFSRSFARFQVIAEPRESQAARVQQMEGLACAVAAGSLGQFFRRRSADFPRRARYLVPDPAKAQAWRARLEALGPGVKVGLSWTGGLQKTGRSRRSLPLEALRPLLSLGGTQWVSLQHFDSAAEIARLAAAGLPVHEFPGVTRDIDDLASLVEALDLVVSVCNTNVHVAGAIGKEVLVMAPFAPEWRYGMSGERMAWYPSARVFRQAAYGEWGGVVARVAEEVKARLAQSRSPHVVDQ